MSPSSSRLLQRFVLHAVHLELDISVGFIRRYTVGKTENFYSVLLPFLNKICWLPSQYFMLSVFYLSTLSSVLPAWILQKNFTT